MREATARLTSLDAFRGFTIATSATNAPQTTAANSGEAMPSSHAPMPSPTWNPQ